MAFYHPPIYDSWFEFFLVQIILIPLGFFFSPIEKIHSFFAFRNIFGGINNLQKHKEKVKLLQKQVEKWGLEGKPKKLKMCSGRKDSESISLNHYDKQGYYQIHIGDLKDVVEIDEENGTVTVEPGMMMGRLSRILTDKGWTIPVVPELPTLIVGGLIVGQGIETSSHKYGLFCDTVLRMEILCPDGKVLECSESHDPELFHAIPGSYGTLGFLTSVTFPLIPAGQYVKLEYHLTQNIQEALQKIESSSKGGYDFIEGFALDKDEIIIMSGRMTGNSEPSKVNYVNAWYKPFFCLQAEKIADKLQKNPSETYYEYIPLQQYYHRHTRGTFWLLLELFPYFKTQQWGFKLFGWAIPTDILFAQSFAPKFLYNPFRDLLVVQDYIMESSKIPEFFRTCDNILGIFPVWICPIRLANENTMFPCFKEMGIDVGYYGFPRSQKYQKVETLKQLEQLTIANKGFNLLYAGNFLTKQDFGNMFKTDRYNKVRKERGCLEAFPDAWEKACKRNM